MLCNLEKDKQNMNKQFPTDRQKQDKCTVFKTLMHMHKSMYLDKRMLFLNRDRENPLLSTLKKNGSTV